MFHSGSLTATSMLIMRDSPKKSAHGLLGNYNYTETKEYNVVRSGSIVLEGLPADGSRKIEDALMEAIEPFDCH